MMMGLGYGWLPNYQAEKPLNNGTLVEIAPELQIELPLYWHHWRRQSIQLESLTKVLIEQAQLFLNGD